MSKNIIIKAVQHFNLITRHKWKVLKLCCKAEIPYQYTVEMICDYLAASLIYNGKNWTKDKPLQYWNKTKATVPMNSQNKAMLTDVFEQVNKQGIKKTITKSNLKNLYHQYCEPVEEIKL